MKLLQHYLPIKTNFQLTVEIGHEENNNDCYCSNYYRYAGQLVGRKSDKQSDKWTAN